MSDWQPIETAPRDGTEILAYSEHGCTGVMLVRHTSMGEFMTDAEIAEIRDIDEDALWQEDWFAADFIVGERLGADVTPTHWMHLPATPATA